VYRRRCLSWAEFPIAIADSQKGEKKKKVKEEKKRTQEMN
jgi:hypothetical protein